MGHQLKQIAVVFVTMASLAFAAFTMALVRGGPNWDKLADRLSNAPEFGHAVSFQPPQIPKGPWVGTHNRTGATIHSDPLLPAVVLKSQERVLKDLKDQINVLKAQIDKETLDRDQSKQTIAVDMVGLESRSTAYAAQLKQISTDIAALTEKVSQQGVALTAVQKELEERRFEVYRLSQQLELLRDDLFGAQQQRDVLRDELLQLNESQRRLNLRNKQIEQQLNGDY